MGNLSIEIILLWVVCAVASGLIANIKSGRLDVWILVGLMAGPLGILAALLFSGEKKPKKVKPSKMVESAQEKERRKQAREMLYGKGKL